MKFYFLLILTVVSGIKCFGQFQFISPMPGGKNLPIEHNIIIRQGNAVLQVDAQMFSISGMKSGNVAFRLIVCDDKKTLNLNPLHPFEYDDTITVSMAEGAVSVENNGTTPAFQFNFTTAGINVLEERQEKSIWENDETTMNDTVQKVAGAAGEDDTMKLCTVTTNLLPAEGNIFFDCQQAGDSSRFLLAVINNQGDSVFQKNYTAIPYDFHLEQNGYFITYRGDKNCYALLDSNFHELELFSIANGFSPDPHDCRITPDGYVFLIGVEDQANGGENNQLFRGSVIQEFDPHHNIIFEWRSADHIDISEATHLNEAAGILDYVHTNSIDIDADGNIITSNRNIDQVNKIDTRTGAFIWRLGGIKNEFTFINDPSMFSRQHDCRRLPNGNITLYDNGNYHAPPRSYAKEYRLDEGQKTATLVWSYTHPVVEGTIPYYMSMGSVQRLPNGNTFINWGKRAQPILPSMTEVDSAGNIVWEMRIAGDGPGIAYRAHKYEWNPCARPSADSMQVTNVSANSATLFWQQVANANQQYEVQYKVSNAESWLSQWVPWQNNDCILKELQPSAVYNWRLRSWCDTLSNTVSAFSETGTFTTAAVDHAGNFYVLPYPNPAHDEVTIQSPGAETIQLYSITGQKMLEFNCKDAENSSIKIPLSSLVPGLYVVVAGNAENRTAALLNVVN